MSDEIYQDDLLKNGLLSSICICAPLGSQVFAALFEEQILASTQKWMKHDATINSVMIHFQ